MFEVETGLIFWTVISFLILLVLLYKVVFPPIAKVLDQRRQAIEGGLEKAKQAQAEGEGLLAKYHQQMLEAEKKTREILDDAQRKSQFLRDETLRSAQKEAIHILENTKKDIENYKRRSMESLKEEIVAMVVEVSSRLIQKELKAADHIKLIEASIKELDKSVKRQV